MTPADRERAKRAYTQLCVAINCPGVSPIDTMYIILADERKKALEEAAKLAEIEWCHGQNSIVRLEEIATGLCDRIAKKIRALIQGDGKSANPQGGNS